MGDLYFFKIEKEWIKDVSPMKTSCDKIKEGHCDALSSVINNAKDAATARYVLMQIFNWFKTDFKQLPLVEADPFTDCFCNVMLKKIYDMMGEITRRKRRADEEGIL